MDGISSNYGVNPRTNISQTVQDNSGKIAAGGAVGAATFSTIKNSAKIGEKVVRTVNETQLLQAANKAKVLNIFSKFKFLNNPVARKLAGPLAVFAGLSSFVGSAAKVADTCHYLSEA